MKCKLEKSNRGVALIIVLWMLSLLTILAAGYSNEMRTETNLTSNLVHSAKAKALAEAGIWQGVTELLKPVSDQVWIPDGTSYPFEFNNNEINVRLFDETGKIDLNTAKPELIEALLESVESLNYDESLAISDAILDWRDKDNLVRTSGAEDEEYEQAGYTYGAKDGPFNTLSELQQVMGMKADIYKKLRPAITIYSRKTTVNQELAPQEVLMILPEMSEQDINGIMERRNFPIESDTLIGADLKRRYNTAGKTFTVYSEAIIGKNRATISAVVLLKRNGKYPFSVLSWQEDEVLEKITENPETGMEDI